MIEVMIEVETHEEGLEKMIVDAAEAALADQNRKGDIDVLVVDDAAIHKLNMTYRNVDRPTDVLSFPANEGDAIASAPDGFLGDIVISLDRARAQAEEYGHTLLREISFLTIHGSLHIMGYDHIDEDDKAIMFALQDEILGKMRITR